MQSGFNRLNMGEVISCIVSKDTRLSAPAEHLLRIELIQQHVSVPCPALPTAPQ